MNDRPLLKSLLLVTVVLVLPLILLALSGEFFAGQLAQWQVEPPPRGLLALAVVAILASDVFLPIPSGPVSTFAGSQLGVALGTAASTLGMTLGATAAFALARRWGRPLAERYSSQEALAAAEQKCRDHGPWMLALTRPLPIFAEAAALVVGALRMPWRKFLLPVVTSNLAISLAYAALGAQAAEQGWLPLAIAATIAIPLAIALYWKRKLRK